MTDGFVTYKLFLALSRHFNSDTYDYFKYNGKISASRDAFEKRKDKYFFHKLGKTVDKNDLVDYIIANILKGKQWIRDFLVDDSRDNFLKYQKQKQGLAYFLDKELSIVLADRTPQQLFSVPKNSYPELLWDEGHDKVSLITLVVLNDFIQFVPVWDSKINKNDLIWPTVKRKIIKLKPFIKYDHDKIKEIIKKHVF